jgi:hypothetical protein
MLTNMVRIWFDSNLRHLFDRFCDLSEIIFSPISMDPENFASSDLGTVVSAYPANHLRFRLLDGTSRFLISHLIKNSPLCRITYSNLAIQFWITVWSSSKVTLSNRFISRLTIKFASANLRFCKGVLAHPKRRSCPDSDQPNRMDGPVARSSFG